MDYWNVPVKSLYGSSLPFVPFSGASSVVLCSSSSMYSDYFYFPTRYLKSPTRELDSQSRDICSSQLTMPEQVDVDTDTGLNVFFEPPDLHQSSSTVASSPAPLTSTSRHSLSTPLPAPTPLPLTITLPASILLLPSIPLPPAILPSSTTSPRKNHPGIRFLPSRNPAPHTVIKKLLGSKHFKALLPLPGTSTSLVIVEDLGPTPKCPHTWAFDCHTESTTGFTGKIPKADIVHLFVCHNPSSPDCLAVQLRPGDARRHQKAAGHSAGYTCPDCGKYFGNSREDSIRRHVDSGVCQDTQDAM